MKKFLQIISLIFEPFLVSFFTLAVVINRTNLTLEGKLLWFAISIVIGGLPPLVTLVIEKKLGLISDWFIYKREERRDVEIAWVGGSLALVIISVLLNSPHPLLAVYLDYFVLGVLFSLINLRWKISVHASMITLFVLALVLFESPIFVSGIFLIFLVNYSRWYLHKHTLAQLSGGTLLTLVVSYLIFAYFNLASF